MEIYYVYINYSEKFDKYYIGQTENFESRILLHNSGLVKSTSPYVPWINVLLIEKTSRLEVMDGFILNTTKAMKRIPWPSLKRSIEL
nr:GIY-YIG nuclease family protein [uncultured Fluviicola sp.]